MREERFDVDYCRLNETIARVCRKCESRCYERDLEAGRAIAPVYHLHFAFNKAKKLAARQNVINSKEGQAERQGDANTDAVSGRKRQEDALES